MILRTLTILNYKNIREAELHFSPKLNCLIGLNGQGKTNVLDSIYYLSFTKSAYNTIDSLNITHGENLCMIQGDYEQFTISMALRRGVKKQFRLGKKDYSRLIDHIGLIPLVMISPADGELISEGSDERRRFMDMVIAQQDKTYIEHLTQYNALLKQRNSLLKQMGESESPNMDMLEVYEMQMCEPAQYIYETRSHFMAQFEPFFQEVYSSISEGQEQVSVKYVSQLQDRDLSEAWERTRTRDIILGWTSQGIHKDEIEMYMGDYPLKQVASQGQQKTYIIAMKLAQSLYLSQQLGQKPILLLDDIFDKLDAERVERIVYLVDSDRFGQIFITDTNRQHLTSILRNMDDASTYYVKKGEIKTSPLS